MPSFAVYAADAVLEPASDGSALLILHEDDKVERGIWEIGPGVVTDTEEDEIFTVISGRATIEINGGPTLEVGPGDVVVFRGGDQTTWTVHERLRKVYQITLQGLEERGR